VPDEVLAGLSYEEFARNLRRSAEAQGAGTAFTLVAEDERGQVVGVASTAPTSPSDAPYTAQIRVLYVLPACQGRGVGRALVRAAIEQLVTAGHVAMVIWVLRANSPARGFYEALGGHLVGERTREILGFVGEEVAYGWPDLGA
jgi:GNAT superfamily N-acetyltransferase